jgi:tetratricopeptide (TPR) repeat protein
MVIPSVLTPFPALDARSSQDSDPVIVSTDALFRPTRKGLIDLLLLGVLLFTSPMATAASFEFMGVESVFRNPPETSEMHTYAIVITSNRRQYSDLPKKYRRTLQDFFVYQTQVKVDGETYYRLAAGNFSDSKPARAALQQLRQSFPYAWIYRRSAPEIKQLTHFLDQSSAAPGSQSIEIARDSIQNLPETAKAAPETIKTAPDSAAAATGMAPDAPGRAKATSAGEKAAPDSASQLLDSARQEFIDANYARVIAIADKVVETGNLSQAREALELAGITRERQGKFEQAIVLYEALLDTDPSAEDASRIQGRIEGIRTMSLAPKSRIETKQQQRDPDAWNFRGIVQQFYLDDVIESSEEGSEAINRTLITDVDMFIEKRTDTDTLAFRIDAGLVSDFLDSSNESRVSNANVQYERDEFRLIGGRQTRTLTGVYGRFDGLTFSDLSHSDFQLSYGFGFLAESPFDDPDSDRPFYGANLEFSPYPGFDVDLYLIDQEIDDLTDRQAVGGEVMFQNQAGYVYGFADYDFFYELWTNFSLISNFQVNAILSLNATLSQGYLPTLSTINALQGLPVATIDELKDVFTDDQIYRLAQDRSSEAQNIIIGTNFRFDSTRYLYISFSSFKLDETVASGTADATPSYEDLLLSVDYSFRGLFYQSDYATLGARISDSDTNETVSINMRTRFTGYKGISFDPRLELDRRTDKDEGFDQWIVRPSIKMQYRLSKKLNLEGTLGIEYSDLDLPELDDQTIYSIYLGYFYLL